MSKKSLLGKVFFLALLLLFVPLVSKAAADSKDVKIEKNNGELTLIVEEEAEYYKFYKDEELVYEGNNNSYSEMECQH